MLTCRKDAGSRTTDDFKGKTLASWVLCNEFLSLAGETSLELAAPKAARMGYVLKQGFNVTRCCKIQRLALVDHLTITQYWQVIDAGLTPDDL